MIHALNLKNIDAISPVAIATNATATSIDIDTLGASYALITLHQNVATATNSSATLKSIVLNEGDTTSAYSAISGFGGLTAASGTSFAITVGNSTSQGAQIQFGVDLRGRKRYLQLVCTALPTTSAINTISAEVKLARLNQAPDSASEAGVIQQVFG